MLLQLPASAQPTVVTNAAVTDVPGAVQQLLNQRATAVTNGDADAFMSTVDPKASLAFRESQARLFSGLHSVSFAGFSLSPHLEFAGDLNSGLRLEQKYQADKAFLPETQLTYRLSGYDDRNAVDDLWLTYVERNRRWYVASDTDAALLGLQTAREPWDFGTVTVKQLPHFLVLSDPAHAVRAAALGVLAEQALTIFQSRWTEPWSQRVPLIVPSSPEQAATLLATNVDVADFVAFVAYVPLREIGWTITAPRIYIQDNNLSGLPPGVQVDDLVHELTHVATATLAGPDTPTWLQEGLAEWIRLGRPTDGRPPVGHFGTLPHNADFVSDDPKALHLAYVSAASAMAFLAARHGMDAPVRLFKAVGMGRVETGSASFRLSQAFEGATGETLPTFVDAWAAQPDKP